ncbi:MAG TPA: universal stress protein [Bacteroidales bacterium]|nr:universal stress protein [Bacteroidales bacterium]
MENNSFTKILVATDYSDLSENAVNTASALCRKHHAALTLLHVVRDAPEYTPMAEFHPAQSYTAEMKQAAKAQLHHLGDRIREEYQIPVDEIVSYGEVVKQIVKTIREAGPDLVLIGTHGASGFRRFFIGSTAYRVIKHTQFPVLTVPGEGDWSTFRNILLPVRLVPDALKKYEVTRPIILTDQPMMHILGLSMESDPESVSEVYNLEEEMERRLEEDKVPYDVSFQRCHNYADKILEVAQKRHADLIVIIATIDKTRGEFFIGPFSQQILNHAKVPVLCVRPG